MLPVQDRFTEWTGAGVPVPVRVSVVVGLCALLAVNVNVAFATPATVGLNVTVNGTLWPAAIVVGNVKPLTTKTELFEVAPVTVTLAPVALRLPEPDPLSPATTLPRFMAVGLTVSCPAWLTVIPVPESDSVVVEVCALLVKVSVALAAPVAVGWKVTVNGTLPPTGMVAGNVKPLTVNTALFVLAADTVTIAPLALRVPVAVPLLPTVTLPTFNVAGLTVRVPG